MLFRSDTMLVEFHTGARYVYSPVTAHQFGAIISAESVGQTLNILIKENDDVSYVQVD